MSEGRAGLLRRIRLGEDSHLELKQVVFSGGKVRGPRRATIADDLAAFANAQGGTLVLGVDDRTKDMVGIPRERLDDVVRLVDEVCRDTVDPPLEATVRCLELPDTPWPVCWRAVPCQMEYPGSRRRERHSWTGVARV